MNVAIDLTFGVGDKGFPQRDFPDCANAASFLTVRQIRVTDQHIWKSKLKLYDYRKKR